MKKINRLKTIGVAGKVIGQVYQSRKGTKLAKEKLGARGFMRVSLSPSARVPVKCHLFPPSTLYWVELKKFVSYDNPSRSYAADMGGGSDWPSGF